MMRIETKIIFFIKPEVSLQLLSRGRCPWVCQLSNLLTLTDVCFSESKYKSIEDFPEKSIVRIQNPLKRHGHFGNKDGKDIKKETCREAFNIRHKSLNAFLSLSGK